MEKNEVIEIIKGHGYYDAVYLGEWKGYNIYEPILDKDGGFFGRPFYVSERNGELEVIRDSNTCQKIARKFNC